VCGYALDIFIHVRREPARPGLARPVLAEEMVKCNNQGALTGSPGPFAHLAQTALMAIKGKGKVENTVRIGQRLEFMVAHQDDMRPVDQETPWIRIRYKPAPIRNSRITPSTVPSLDPSCVRLCFVHKYPENCECFMMYKTDAGTLWDELCHETEIPLPTAVCVPFPHGLHETFQTEDKCGDVNRFTHRDIAL